MHPSLPFPCLAFAMLAVACNSASAPPSTPANTEAEPDRRQDARAIEVLDQVTAAIGVLDSCSYTAFVVDTPRDGEPTERHYDIYLRGPDKLHLRVTGPFGERGYWYDGKELTYFSFTDNLYGTVPAPDNTLATVDAVYKKYGVKFPGGDFFYPTLTDDVLTVFPELLFWGSTPFAGREYIELEAANETDRVHTWIGAEDHLPYKLVNLSEDPGHAERFEVTFSDWEVNPDLPDSIFRFTAPEGAEKLDLRKAQLALLP